MGYLNIPPKDFCQYSSVRGVSSQTSNTYPIPPYHGFKILMVLLLPSSEIQGYLHYT